MTSPVLPICYSCKNFLKKDEGLYFNCKAFPKGIPIEIIEGENNHKKPFKGDNGIQFEPIEE